MRKILCQPGRWSQNLIEFAALSNIVIKLKSVKSDRDRGILAWTADKWVQAGKPQDAQTLYRLLKAVVDELGKRGGEVQ